MSLSSSRIHPALAIIFAATASCTSSPSSTTATSAPAPAQAAAPAPGQAAVPRPPTDSVTASRARFVSEVLAQIKGREQVPAESVFKNVKMMKALPASRLLAVMNLGYGKSLGVSCDHCHVTGKWESEEKPQKQIAREMAAMVANINGQLLPKIANLKGERPTVNCTTCHRGALTPALNIP
ncbi:MAG: c-type cytochrome [Gemmatimonadota bacterium]|nr:c-type cytochrome [Gemmatimonadota bacterium]